MEELGFSILPIQSHTSGPVSQQLKIVPSQEMVNFVILYKSSSECVLLNVFFLLKSDSRSSSLRKGRISVDMIRFVKPNQFAYLLNHITYNCYIFTIVTICAVTACKNEDYKSDIVLKCSKMYLKK